MCEKGRKRILARDRPATEYDEVEPLAIVDLHRLRMSAEQCFQSRFPDCAAAQRLVSDRRQYLFRFKDSLKVAKALFEGLGLQSQGRSLTLVVSRPHPPFSRSLAQALLLFP